MFDWLRKRAFAVPPSPRGGENPANPGIGALAEWTFNDGRRTWQESMNLLTTLESLLKEHGRSAQVEGAVVLDLESQLSLRPLLYTLQPVHENGVRTSTTIEIKHPTRILSPVFEYQHSAGPNLEESLMAGFRLWYDSDFVALMDAVRDQATDCMELFDHERRITLGPLIHECQVDAPLDDSEHALCPCCMFTKTMDAYKSLPASAGFYALRLYAARDSDGQPLADCRLNGEDYPAGKKALIEYAQTWKGAGVESRKQYVLVQT